MTKKTKPLHNQPLGAHLSIGKGFAAMIDDGESIGCTAIGMFLHSNRQWAMKDLPQTTITSFKERAKQSTIQAFVVHASYLINIGSHQKEIRTKSIHTLTKELYQCHQLGIHYLAMHPGSYSGSTTEETCERLSEGIDEAFAQSKSSTMLLIENMSGQGSVLGSKLEELASIRNKIQHKSKVGFCFDTCHGFAAGYDFTTPRAYKNFWEHFDKVIGLEHLKAFHINDSKRECGSRIDRHENIGKGKMGIEPFKLLMNDDRFADRPKILETPYKDYKHDALKLYAENLYILRNLIS